MIASRHLPMMVDLFSARRFSNSIKNGFSPQNPGGEAFHNIENAKVSKQLRPTYGLMEGYIKIVHGCQEKNSSAKGPERGFMT